MRELIVAGGFSALVMIPFMIFVAAGWPGEENSCVTGGPWYLQTHAFQFHGLWHCLAGAAAILLYFFWRAAPR